MKVYLVGGAVRDKLLNLSTKEHDWVVVGSNPEEMMSLGYKPVGSEFPVFLHPKTKEEYALARTEKKSGKGHKGFTFDSHQSVTLEQDLKRRDLTINAIALSKEGNFIDPCKGKDDIKNKLLRKVSESFDEDPLRVLRVARFASKLKHLDFVIEEKTLLSMKKISNSGELKTLPKERIWLETLKALNEKDPQEYFKMLYECKAMGELVEGCDINLDFFKKIIAKITGGKGRWLALVACASKKESLGEAFGVPKKLNLMSTILKKLIKFGKDIKLKKSDEVLNLLEEIDGFRRNERFLEVNEVYKAYKPLEPLLLKDFIDWEKLTNKLLKVKPSSSKLKGKEIAHDLRLKRIKIIEEQFNSKNGR